MTEEWIKEVILAEQRRQQTEGDYHPTELAQLATALLAEKERVRELEDFVRDEIACLGGRNHDPDRWDRLQTLLKKTP